METLRTDVAVVGAGPIGLELAVALKRAGIDYQHFDAKQIGYTVSWFAPGTRFFSSNERIAIAGVPLHTPDQGKATREEYLNYLRAVVEQFDLEVHTYEPVVNIERRDGHFVLTTRRATGPRTCVADQLVLVTGGTDHPRRLNIPGEDLPHVSHYFQDPHTYFRKRVLIVGGKNSAVEAALRCHHAGAHVSLSYRRDALSPKHIKYWLMPEITGLMESGRIPAYFGTAPTEITPTQVRLARSPLAVRSSDDEDSYEQVEEATRRTDAITGNTLAAPASSPRKPTASRPIPEPQTLNPPFDFVLLLVGYEQDNGLLRAAGVELRGDCGAPIYDDRTMETSVPNLYVAGTAVAGTQDKYRVFIENCHVHVDRIMAAITGAAVPERAARPVGLPES